LAQRSGKFRAPKFVGPPLSLKNITSVFCVMPSSSSACSTRPML